jgi:hypothetical protein
MLVCKYPKKLYKFWYCYYSYMSHDRHYIPTSSREATNWTQGIEKSVLAKEKQKLYKEENM